MSIESQADWDGLRAVSKVARQTLALLSREVRAGITTGELDALAKTSLQSCGARSAPAGLSGHRVGRTLHEPPNVPNEWDATQTAILTDGLVITIEPMVTTGTGRPVEAADGWTISTRDRRLAAHHEDTIVVTRGRPEVLTEAWA
jgi:methionyl aminopeptidase